MICNGWFLAESPIYFIKIVKISTIYYLSIAGFKFYVYLCTIIPLINSIQWQEVKQETVVGGQK